MSNQYLSNNQLIEKIQQQPGLIPVDLNSEQKQLIWLDMGRYHVYEGRFRNALSSFSALRDVVNTAKPADYFTTEANILDSAAIVTNPVYPSAFIFHMGRCGSTLLTKVLARSRCHLVFGEARPHTGMSALLDCELPESVPLSERNLSRFRRLILAMGRRRHPDYSAHFIKFTSTNLLFLDLITAAFPDVPSIFLYRHPAEVLVSFLRNAAGWHNNCGSDWGAFITGLLKADTVSLDKLSYYDAALGNMLSAALRGEALGLSYLHYNQLTAENLPTILAALKVTTAADQLSLMQSEFDCYSKDDYKLTPFNSDAAEKQQMITPEINDLVRQKLQPLYQRLLQSSQNIIVAHNHTAARDQV